jgi:probable HAF family extracellular repeat protein
MRAPFRSLLRRLMATGALCALLAAGPGVHRAAAQARYAIEDLGAQDEAGDAFSINDRGEVTGTIYAGDAPARGFLWMDGLREALSGLGRGATWPYGINDAGQVVGVSSTVDPAALHAVEWSSAGIEDLGTLGGRESCATGINDAGEVVGWSEIAGSRARHAFCETAAVMEDLGTLGGADSYAYGLNAAGQIAGFSATAAGPTHAVRWDQRRMEDIGTLGGAGSWGYSLNDAGHMVGYSYRADDAAHAFRWIDGRMQDLGTLGGTHSLAYGINAADQVVGASFTAGNLGVHAFLYTDALGMIDLNARIDPALGWTLVRATGINRRGQIVGLGLHQGQRRPFRLTP